jgi:formate-dependent phosphoribosylglycinamide formyltransferase (GAR transformylase)
VGQEKSLGYPNSIKRLMSARGRKQTVISLDLVPNERPLLGKADI